MIAGGDESIRSRWHWLAIVTVSQQDVGKLDRLVRSLHLPGQRRLHFKSEGTARRRTIISRVVESNLVRARVYRAPRPVVEARESCLRAAMSDLIESKSSRLILDLMDEQQATRDRAVINESLRRAGATLHYLHAPSRDNAVVQVADVVAWAYGADGDWRRRIKPMIEKTTDAGPWMRETRSTGRPAGNRAHFPQLLPRATHQCSPTGLDSPPDRGTRSRSRKRAR
jgi:hypothetical protein